MSNYGLWIVIFVFFIILPALRSRTRRRAAASRLIRKKRKRGIDLMNKIVMSYVGKECLIYTMSSTEIVTGVVEAMEDGWITVRSFDGQTTEAVNAEYVTRIKEYPKNKNGKRKAIV